MGVALTAPHRRVMDAAPLKMKEKTMKLQAELVRKQLQSSAMVLTAISLAFLGSTIGCSSKNYVKSQTAPLVANVNELDSKTAADHRMIAETDERATKGIASAQSAADSANQHAMTAGAAADAANSAATDSAHRVDSLAGVIANLDQYKQLQDVSVTFGFDKAALTAADKADLDQLGGSLNSTRGYILSLTGGTDTVGDANYNYQLSQRRADAVVTYLSAKYNVPPHKFYLVAIGKDQQIDSARTAAARAKNRRVEILLLSNMQQGSDGAAGAQASNQ